MLCGREVASDSGLSTSDQTLVRLCDDYPEPIGKTAGPP